MSTPAPSERRRPKGMMAKKKKTQEPQPISEELEEFDDTDALTMASMQGNVEAVAVLIESGVSVDHKDSIGVAPLHWAAFCGHASVISQLIEAKADIHCRDREGRTPLHVAAYERSAGQCDVLAMLIRLGADLHSPDKAGWTPLHCAVSNGVAQACQILSEGAHTPGSPVSSPCRPYRVPIVPAGARSPVGS